MTLMTMTMKKILYGALAAFLLSVSGCASGNDDGQVRTGKLEYEPENNLVEVIRLERGDFTRQLIANGHLSARKKISMHFGTQAVVSEIAVRNGQSVKAGEVIASQDAEDKVLALESARISLDKAELDYLDVLAGQGYQAGDTVSVPANVRTMARVRSGYDAALVSFARAEHDWEGTVLKAPFDGKIADVKIHRYDMSGSDPFCTLIDDSVFDVDFSVMESEYPFMETGLGIKIIPFFGEGKILYGKITAVNPKVTENGHVAVTAEVANDGTLIDGMNVKIIVERTVPDMLVVPKSAVLIRDNKEVLFRYSDGKSLWTYVNVLMSNAESHAVTANIDRGAELSPGDTVIISGNLNIADGSQVVIKE